MIETLTYYACIWYVNFVPLIGFFIGLGALWFTTTGLLVVTNVLYKEVTCEKQRRRISLRYTWIGLALAFASVIQHFVF